jgi:predicted RNA-binding Zn ribbon-like protein
MRGERRPPTPTSLSPEKPFRFIGGDPSIDFVNTVDWGSKGIEHERITGYERFVEWANAAAVISEIDKQRLRRRARSSPRLGAAAYRQAMWARWVLQRLYSAIATGDSTRTALREFNALLGGALARMELESLSPTSPAFARSWHGMGEELVSPLWPILWHGCALMMSDELPRLRVCGGADCGWMYVDRSRNGLRRWCRMETCGTQEKNRRRVSAGA